MNLLIIEDEIPAFEKLQSFVQSELQQANIIGWARSKVEAKKMLKQYPDLDLIFSDIELLDGVSFEVFEQHRVQCPIIFCTGFDQYLLKAFQSNGIAYLLKPYSIEEFKVAIQKYHTLFQPNHKMEIDESILSQLKTVLQNDKKSYKQRFAIKKKDGIKLINVSEIVCFEAQGDFSMAIDQNEHKHIINQTLSNIEEKLDPKKFFRINRSQIIHIDFIEKIEPYFKNKLAITLNSLNKTLYTSSNSTPNFRKWIEG